MARSRPRSVEESVLRLEEHVDRDFRALEETVDGDLPGLRSAVGKSRSQVESALASLGKTLDKMTRDREQNAIAQIRRAAANLYPGGIPQERALATWVYLARHGDRFLEAARSAVLGSSPEGTSSPEDRVAGTTGAE